MVCWKCKSEMPEGLKYCGNCGVHMNRAVWFVQWLFSKKGLPVLIGVLVLALVIGGVAIWQGSAETAVTIDPEMGWYHPKEQNIVYYDESQSYGYVNNMVLVYFMSDATDEQIMEVVDSVEGEVVGVLPGIRQYQIEIAARSEEELEALRLELLRFDAVKNVVIDYVFAMETNGISIPDDPWKDYGKKGYSNSWDEENPGGTNWWVEATHLLSAWGYQEFFTPISVGIVDKGYDATHEDLKLTILNPDEANVDEHGTHVAGIMGATADNGKGITGVLKNAKLYCVDAYLGESRETSTGALLGAIDLCIYSGCRVVNDSNGFVYKYVRDHPERVESDARITAEGLIMLLDAYGPSFIVVQGAGNNSVIAAQYAGMYASITPEIAQSVLDEMLADGVKLETEITVEDIMNSFMVVGAVDIERNSGQYQLWRYSNYGDAITVCAPGVRILSTVPYGNGYDYKSGTSMAAPIVSGITAMVWSVDPDMSAGEVKYIITSTATSGVRPRVKADKGNYYMINAKAAVEKALEWTGDNYPSAEDLFDNTCWEEYDDRAEGGHYVALFQLDGTFQAVWEARRIYDEGTYQYDATNGYLTMEFASSEELRFKYSDGKFVVIDNRGIPVSGGHVIMELAPDHMEYFDEGPKPEPKFPEDSDLLHNLCWEQRDHSSYNRNYAALFHEDGTFWSFHYGSNSYDKGVYEYNSDTGYLTLAFALTGEIHRFGYTENFSGNGHFVMIDEDGDAIDAANLVLSLAQEQIYLFDDYSLETEPPETEPEPPYGEHPAELLGRWCAYERTDGTDYAWTVDFYEDGTGWVGWSEPGNGYTHEAYDVSWFAEDDGSGFYVTMRSPDDRWGTFLYATLNNRQLRLERNDGMTEDMIANVWYERDLDYKTWLERKSQFAVEYEGRHEYVLLEAPFLEGNSMTTYLWYDKLELDTWIAEGGGGYICDLAVYWDNLYVGFDTSMFLTNWGYEEDGRVFIQGTRLEDGRDVEYLIGEDGQLAMVLGGNVYTGEFTGIRYGEFVTQEIASDCVYLDHRGGETERVTRYELQKYLDSESNRGFTYITATYTAREDGVYITQIEIPYFP